jgi:hypothetical protein
MKATRPCVVFLHLPKTGGMTLKSALRYRYRSQAVFLEELSDPMGGVAKVPDEDLRRARVVMGHLHYGVHRYIPQECEYITVLREPVKRVPSMYHYARRKQTHRLHDQLIQSGIGLDEFVRTATDPGLDNLYTRMVSGTKPGRMASAPGGKTRWVAPELDREDLEQAKRNLDRFRVVGLTERFDETFILIRRALGWKLPMYETHNVKQGPRSEPPSFETIELIRQRNQLDLELYAHAKELFSAAVEREGASFGRELTVFKALNRIPNTLGPRIPRPLRHSLRAVLPR